MKNVLMGIGNELRLDDGVGHYIATQFSHPDWLTIDCHTVPENFTGLIKQKHPEQLILVDAAQMDLSAGEIRVIPIDKIEDLGIGTHALPMSLVINVMQPYVDKPINFIGIQPERLGDGQGLSPAVKQAADQLMQFLIQQKVEQLISL